MARTTWILATTTALGVTSSTWLWFANRSLHDELDAKTPAPVAEVAKPAEGSAAHDVTPDPKPGAPAKTDAREGPSLPNENPTEARMGRRQQRQAEFGAMFGRLDGESEDEYRARVG